MTVPCAEFCFESKAQGGNWVSPVTEATAASNVAIGIEIKQARSEFSLLGLKALSLFRRQME